MHLTGQATAWWVLYIYVPTPLYCGWITTIIFVTWVKMLSLANEVLILFFGRKPGQETSFPSFLTWWTKSIRWDTKQTPWHSCSFKHIAIQIWMCMLHKSLCVGQLIQQCVYFVGLAVPRSEWGHQLCRRVPSIPGHKVGGFSRVPDLSTQNSPFNPFHTAVWTCTVWNNTRYSSFTSQQRWHDHWQNVYTSVYLVPNCKIKNMSQNCKS